MTIRLLGPGDEGAFASIAEGVFDDPVATEAARMFLADPRPHIAVAFEDGEMIAMATGVEYVHPDKTRPELWINEVGVATKHRGRGVGTAIVAALLGAARAAGCTEAWVQSEPDNAAAIRLYSRLGGTASGQIMYTFRLTAPASAAEPPRP